MCAICYNYWHLRSHTAIGQGFLRLLRVSSLDAVRATNKYITDMEPWKMKDDPVGRTRVVKSTLEAVYVLAHFMAPYIPDAVAKIFERLGTKPRPIKELSPKFNNLAVGTEIKVGEVLFVKFEKEGDKKGKK